MAEFFWERMMPVLLTLLIVAGIAAIVSAIVSNASPVGCVDAVPDPRCHEDARLVIEEGIALCRCEVSP